MRTLGQQAEELEGKIGYLDELVHVAGWKIFCQLVEENRQEIAEKIDARSLPEKPDYVQALCEEAWQKGVKLGLAKAVELPGRVLELMRDEVKMLHLQMEQNQQQEGNEDDDARWQ